jgi:hypothetical protein
MFLRSCAALLVLVLLFAGEVRSQASDPLKEFFGRYVGQGVAKNRDNLYFGVQLRDLDTTIEPAGDGGFKVGWITVSRDGDGQVARRSEQSLAFKRSDKPGLYVSEQSKDPAQGGLYAWARLEPRVLTINIVEVTPSGAGVWSIYERRLTGDGLELTFRRIEPGGTARIVAGRLKRER